MAAYVGRVHTVGDDVHVAGRRGEPRLREDGTRRSIVFLRGFRRRGSLRGGRRALRGHVRCVRGAARGSRGVLGGGGGEGDGGCGGHNRLWLSLEQIEMT